MKHSTRNLVLALSVLSTLNLQPSTCLAQGTAFTYQGRLNGSNSPVTGLYEFEFGLHGAATGATLLGTVTREEVPVTNGLFSVEVDFGSGLFTGEPRWLEISVRPTDGPGFVTLTPRQPLTPAPYALFANTVSNLNGTLSAAQLPANAARLDATQTFSATNSFSLPVGIGTNAPTARLHIGGTPGSDGIRFPDGTLQTTAPIPIFAEGLGSDPQSSLRFLSAVVQVEVKSPNQRILVTSHKAFGSTVAGGADSLNLYIGHRPAGSTAAPSVVGNGIFGNRVAANTRVTMGLSAVITGLTPGTYEVGLAGSAGGLAFNWNSNERSYTTAVVY
jgi:hypothetical protein